MSEDSDKKGSTEAMGSLEDSASDAPLSDDLTMRESFGTDMTAPHQAVGDLSEIGGDSTLAAVPTPINIDLRATRQENPAAQQQSVTKVGDGAQQEADDRAELDAKIRRRIAEADASDKPDPLIGKEFGGRFTVTAKVGEGGMGAVYRARQRGMDRDVAVKVLLGDLARNETVVKRFHLEALAVSKLRHPNTIQIFDFGESDDGLLYIAMEFLEGKSLHQVLQEERVLSARRAIKIAQQMAKSLREAHAKGIVHRDLKPDNIFLCTVGEEMDYVKVLDFGVAKLRDGEDGKDLTKTGTIFGTPKYMSPEQASAGIVDPRSDLYAIGVILYEMLTGRAPFMADNSLGILIQHIQEPVPAFEQVQPDLVYPEHVMSLTYRLLGKKPEQRPQTAEALIRECATVLETTEDIYRNVLTRAEAVEIGLEMALTPRTRHDTIISTGESQGAPTEGPFQEPTVAISEEVKPRKGMGLMAAFSALVLVGAGAAVVYASIPPLPETFTNLEGLTSPRIGTLPEIALAMSTIGITTQPIGVVIEGLDAPVTDSSAFNITRPRGSEPVELTFKMEGYKTYSYTFRFDEAVPPPVGITLTRAEDPRPTVVKIARPRRSKDSGASSAGSKGSADREKATTKPATAPAKPAKPAAKKVTRLPAKPGKLSKLKSTKKLQPTLKLKSKAPSKLK